MQQPETFPPIRLDMRVRHKKRGTTYRIAGLATLFPDGFKVLDGAQAFLSFGRSHTGLIVTHAHAGLPAEKFRRLLVQTAEPLTEPTEVVIYYAEATETLWCRPRDEFEDGRFEVISDAA